MSSARGNRGKDPDRNRTAIEIQEPGHGFPVANMRTKPRTHLVAGATCQVDPMRKWVLGEYTVQRAAGAGEVKVPVDASIGLAQWQKGESMLKLIERADTAMYEEKRQSQKSKAAKAW